MAHQQLTAIPPDHHLDLEPWVGQRQASFRFELVNGITGERLGDLHPIRTATLTHDTTRTMKRQLSLDLGIADSAAINPISDRVRPYMTLHNGTVEYPLGQYMFTDASNLVTTKGRLGAAVLNDEMFLVDQEITSAIANTGSSADALITTILDSLETLITYSLEPSPFTVSGSWSTGSNRGQILEAIAVQGDYFSPWFDHSNTLRFIRTFDPAPRLPDFNWDVGNKVIRSTILETSDIFTAPNRFMVISNDATDPTAEVSATADVPATAPHSIANRGFVIARVEDLQLSDTTQAQAVVNGLVNRLTVFERIGISTAPDPRHDSYNVIHWEGANWLELAWSMPLKEGAAMSHLLRKAYS